MMRIRLLALAQPWLPLRRFDSFLDAGASSAALSDLNLDSA